MNRPWQSIFISMRAAISCGLRAGLLAGVLAAPSWALTQPELQAMRDLWNTAGSNDYDFFLQRHCFCPPDEVRPGLVEVRSGLVSRVIDAETSQPLDPSSFLPVEGLFNVLEDALARPAFSVEAQFDATLGYPTSIAIDLEEQLADDEVSYLARDLTLVPEPIGLAMGLVGMIAMTGLVRGFRRPTPGSPVSTLPLPYHSRRT